ncbi:unnamed protein product [Caenorhabditis sp. 36 PRJEB53466]|nr:unnamed protein product [Caenorhabditis sp. 36 PRJEB53466]
MLSLPFLFSFLFFVDGFFSASHPDTLTAFGIPYEDFHCGTKGVVKDMAIARINESCVVAATDFNHCCAVHDDCYGTQRGQEFCDDQLCACLDNHVETVSAKCKELSGLACNLVKIFGHDAYISSFHPTLPLPPQPIAQRRIPALQKIMTAYQDLYVHCPYQNITFSSCALNHDICADKKRDNCVLALINCLEGTAVGRPKSLECDEAIEKTLFNLIDADKPEIVLIEHWFIHKVFRKFSRPFNAAFLYTAIFGGVLLFALLVIVGCTRFDNRVVLDDLPSGMLSIPLLLTTSLMLSAANPIRDPTVKDNSSKHQALPADSWQCAPITRNATFDSEILELCPSSALEVNHCCAIHSDCSMHPRLDFDCASQYCNCLDRIVHEGQNAEKCENQTASTCAQLLFTDILSYPYGFLKRAPEPIPVEKRKVPFIPKIASDYRNLYEKCPFQNVTLYSCALKFDFCSGNSDGCALGLMRCLEGTKEGRAKNKTCDKAIEAVLNGMINTFADETPSPVPDDFYGIIQKVYRRPTSVDSGFYIFLIVFAFFFLVCLVALFAFTRMNDRVVFDEIAPPTHTEDPESTREVSTKSSERN